jgi:predicted permease
MEILPVFSSILLLFLIIAFGYALRKTGVLDTGRVEKISHIIVLITLPALTIASMQVPLSPATIKISEHMIFIALAYYLGAFCLSLAVCHFLPASGPEKGIFQFILVFPNVGFMGIPIAIAILGPDSLFYVSIFNLPYNLLAFTLGIYLITSGSPGKFDPRILLTPGFVASMIGLLLFLAGYTLPSPVGTALGLLGWWTSPLALIVVGALLATLPLPHLAGDWRVAVITAFRLLILPVLAFLVLSPLVHDRLLLEVAVLLIAMPAGSYAVLFAEEYKVDSTLASQGVFLSTLLCFGTIPLIVFLLF